MIPLRRFRLLRLLMMVVVVCGAGDGDGAVDGEDGGGGVVDDDDNDHDACTQPLQGDRAFELELERSCALVHRTVRSYVKTE